MEVVDRYYATRRSPENVMGGVLGTTTGAVCSEIDLIDLNNEFQNLKKEKMSIDDYATAFTENMKLFPYLVPTELSKIEKHIGECSK